MSGVRQEDKYIAIQYLNKTEQYPIEKLCFRLHLSRAGYYKWKKRKPSQKQIINEQLVEWIKGYYEEQDGIQFSIFTNNLSRPSRRKRRGLRSCLSQLERRLRPLAPKSWNL